MPGSPEPVGRDTRGRYGTGPSWPGGVSWCAAITGLATLSSSPVIYRCSPSAARVCVEAQPELLSLLRGLPGIADLVPLGEEDYPPARFGCDAEIEVTELPHAFRTTIGSIPRTVPYLSAERGRSAEGARRLSAMPRRVRAGLVWAAGEWKPERSLCLEQLSPLAAIPGIALVNLQRGPEYRRWREVPAALPMIEVFDSDAIADTATTIANLDLVITVDTMVAHLAGALGAPVWLMLHFAADWRWLLDRRDSPWYPTMRVFRQSRPDDWGPVVREVAAALAAVTAGSTRAPPR